ncbi:hypothetical protein ACVBEJ_14255 [Porticoccus sp. GXU_MW_L64]
MAAAFLDVYGFVEAAVGQGSAIATGVVAVGIVLVALPGDGGGGVRAGVVLAVAVVAHIAFVGDVAQGVILYGFGGAADGVLGEAVKAIVLEGFAQVFVAGLLLAVGEVTQGVPGVVQFLNVAVTAGNAGAELGVHLGSMWWSCHMNPT